MRVHIVANGQDSIFAPISNFWGTPIDARLTPAIVGQGYQVTNLAIITSASVGGIFSDTYPFQATIDLETGVQTSTVAALTAMIRTAIVQATGYEPSAIAVVSAGQIAPTAPSSAADAILSLPAQIAALLRTTTQVATVLIVVIGVGAAYVVYQIAKHPKKFI